MYYNTYIQLTGVIKHVICEGRTLVGRTAARGSVSSMPDAELKSKVDHSIQLSGVSVLEHHALLARKKDTVTIEPLASTAQVSAF
jgi:hypothetical protein